MSLLELLDILEDLTDKRSAITFDGWRPSDRKAYISIIAKAQNELGWEPKINPKDGVGKLVEWAQENK